MEPVSTWEAVLIGVVALLVTLWFRPGIKAAFERSRTAEQKDWAGVLLPLALVALFVLLLIAMV
jgi:hypothetical protein